MKKLSKKLLLLPITVSGMLSVGIASIGMLVKNNVENKVINSIQNSSENADSNTSDKKDLALSNTNYYNPKLSTNSGPIVHWGNTITSLDWFGSKRWSLTTEQINNSISDANPFPTDGYGADGAKWQRSWLNMDLDRENNILYILGNMGKHSTNNKKETQWVVSLDVNQNGKVLGCWELKDAKSWLFFNISVLANGNVMVYSENDHVSTRHVLINPKTNGIKIQGDKGDLENSWPKPEVKDEDVHNNENKSDYNFQNSRNFLMNLIPIAPNRNFAVSYNSYGFQDSAQSNNSDLDHGRKQANSQVEFFLVDDNMKKIDSVSEEWKKPRLITKAITGTKNNQMWPQRDYYKLLDGRIVTVIYDKLIVIDPRNPNDPKLDIQTIKKDKWVESWTFDTNNNIFAKLKDDSVIWKIELREKNNIISQYFDLHNTSNQKINKCANSMSIYNVHGYSGQIMTINNFNTSSVDNNLLENKDNNVDKSLVGLSAAITKNPNIDTGDLKGLLNTNEAFQKSVDFDVKNESLNSKLPSEISRDDLDIKNDGFLTENKDKDNNGNLLYPQITKTEVVDDNNKKLSITVNLDQIPWFVSNGKMPKDIKPTKITKVYSNGSFKVELSSRFTWAPIENDYDFKNTLPEKMDLEYINKLNPLISTLQSQRVSINGKTYPSVEYSIKNKNNSTGKITIEAIYKYLPMEQRAVDSNIKTHTLSKEFTIFKSSDTKNFQFVGNQSQTNVSNIPELKEIKESNTLPSYFNNVKDKREFLKFIDVENTKGFPLEKVDIKAIGDDVNGTLTITVDSSKYDGNRSSIYTKQFTGLNKKQSYKMSFKEPDKSKFDKILKLPSQVNQEDIYLHFLNYDGFDPKDFNVSLSPNDINGQLGVTLKLNKNFPESALKEGTEFVKQNDGSFVAFKQFSGFKTNEEFQKEYQVIFKDVSKLDANKDKDLIELMKLSPSYIENQLKKENGGITIGGTKYNDIKSLSKLFIESTGEKIPKDFNSEGIKGEVFINNSAGEVTIKLTFEKLDGYPNAISFVKTFAGFAKGNDIATEDVLIFYDDNLFFVVNPEYKNKKSSEVKKELDDNKINIKKFFSMEPTGDYKKAIDENNFELEIVSDDNNGSLIITIKFKREHITNKDSLLEYSQVYTGFSSY